jgi:hypothetical protein
VPMLRNKSAPFTIPALLLASLLAACGGGETDSPSFNSSAGGSSTSAASCGYTDLISSGDRSRARSCDPQAAFNIDAADSALSSAIAACQQGQKATADAYYTNTYTKQANYAKQVLALECH